MREAIWQERSFAVHLPVAVAVLACGAFFQVEMWEWLILILCISLVLTAELLNSALERLAKAVTSETNEQVRAALDMGAGAVLMAACGAVLCGSIIFVPHAWSWWQR